MDRGTITLREIFSQAEVWRRCLATLGSLPLESLIKSPHSHKWIFVGCGTSYYLAQAAAASFMTLTGTSAQAVPASEFLLFSRLTVASAPGANFPVLISRSGHTSEVLQVAEALKADGIDFLAVTCDGNELAQLTPRILALPVQEQSTVMTSSFTAMLLALQYIAGRLSGDHGFISALQGLPAELDRLLPFYAPQVKEFASQPFDDAAFLGQGPLYAIASETSLKVMESASSYAQFFHTLEFRHGPKSIVSENVLVAALLSDAGYAEESAVLREMKALGARTLAIANRFPSGPDAAADLSIELQLSVPEIARLAVYVVWGQLLGSYAGLRKGLNPDTPRNLSRVVTLAG
jgi:glucosamine--fructose-6-phosphate aminotransferase (isomerizing)